LNSLFIVEVGFGVPGEETGAAYVFAGLVHWDVVGLEDVVGYGTEPFGMTALGQIDFYNPFEAVAGGAAEEEAGLELPVGFKGLEKVFKVLYVVEVQAE
jgi:hypothetical protein